MMFLKKGFSHSSRFIIRNVSFSLLVKVTAIFSSLALSIALTRYIGAEGFGIINLINRVLSIITVIALFGMPPAIIKEVSISFKKRLFSNIQDSIYSSLIFNGSISLIFTTILIIFAPLISSILFKNSDYSLIIGISSACILPMVFSRIYGAALIGREKVWQSNLVNNALSVFLVLLLVLIKKSLYDNLTITDVILFYIAARIICCFSVYKYWISSFSISEKVKNYHVKKLLIVASPMFFVNVANEISLRADAIILGIFTNPTEVGIYAIAAKIAILTQVFNQITGSVSSSRFASLYNQGKITELKNFVKKICLMNIGIGLVAFLSIVFFGKFILELWGSEFKNVYVILVILAFAQLVRLSTGPMGILLAMTGFQKVQRNLAIIFMALNLTITPIFAFFLGGLGVAVASGISVVFINILRLYFSEKKLKLSLIPFFS